MRNPSSVRLVSAGAAMALLAGCSNGSAIAPATSTTQVLHYQAMSGRIPSVVNPVGMLRRRQVGVANHKASFDACPVTGPIVYVSDFNNSTINIYKVPFAGQAPCGQLTASSGLDNPQGMIVRHNDLFVANSAGKNVLAFHRGAASPYMIYVDPNCGGEFPVDVAVSNDNYVFATNILGGTCNGSISIWQKQTGVLVSNILNKVGAESYFLTIQKDGTLYYDDNSVGLFKGSCAGGTCGSFNNTGAKFTFPGGLRSVDDEDLVLDDQGPPNGDLLTFEPPDFNNPAICSPGTVEPITFDINHRQRRVFIADAGLNEALEFSYPGCQLIGTVPFNAGGVPVGVAKDIPETLH